MSAALPFLNGTITALWVVAFAFFLRYWLLSRDELFVWFAAAFLTLAAHSAIRTFDADASEHATFIYLLRLMAMVMIAIGILRKNRRPPGKSG